MKKLSRREVIKLLREKKNQTFKELASITGYHEKSLNRIAKELKLGNYSPNHKSKGKTPHNKVSNIEKANLVKLWNEGVFTTKKEFYQFLCSKGYSYSYSFVAKIIKKKQRTKPIKKKSNTLLIARKMICENIIQYNNKRYLVDTSISISHHESVVLVVSRNTLSPLYIEYKNKKYSLIYQKQVFSKKGNTKYE